MSMKYPDSVCDPEFPALSLADITRFHESSTEIVQFTSSAHD